MLFGLNKPPLNKPCVCLHPSVYDVTRAETLQHLESKWLEDFKQYSSHEQAVRMVVGNKIDLV
jgi:hypothetical protein